MPDPDLLALPEPRRPFRRLTLVALAATFIGSLWLLVLLFPLLEYALGTGAPQDLGELRALSPQGELHNSFVRAAAELSKDGLAYGRPLDGGAYRVAPVVGQSKLWVEVRIPGELDATRFIPPASFVGRLVHLERAGPAYAALSEALEARGFDDAWLLLDGDSPSSTRWVMGLASMLIGFAVFAMIACIRIVRPASQNVGSQK
jgi:hypothetical protein